MLTLTPVYRHQGVLLAALNPSGNELGEVAGTPCLQQGAPNEIDVQIIQAVPLVMATLKALLATAARYESAACDGGRFISPEERASAPLL